MEIFILDVIVLILAFWAGWHLRAIVFLANLSVNPDKVIKMLEEIKRLNAEEEEGVVAQDASGTELFIERVDNMLYAYVKETNQFVAQGPDLKSLLDSAHKRFPSKKFFGTISKDNPAKELA